MARSPFRWLLSLAPLTLVACASQEPPPEMSMEEMMAKATELAMPGDGHHRLDPLVGKFSTVMTMWMEPGAEPTISEGTSNNYWILDGRFLQQDYQADFMGMPFSGIGMTGYNNATGKYEGSWIDSMSTFMLPLSEGEWDAATNTITSHRTYTNPVTNQETTTRDVVRFGTDNEFRFEMHEAVAGGEERQLFEIVYTRTE